MIRSFFQSLEQRGVEYLLISGQATVLYGAASFSEDIDLWLNPTEDNCRRFLEALRASSGRYYKLTPPFERGYLIKGHGFHFILPGEQGDVIYLDVMGVPPRTSSFSTALGHSLPLETEWGTIPTVSIKDLVEIKKTQRLEDYPIISKLALLYFDGKHSHPSPADIPWALENIFTLPTLKSFAQRHLTSKKTNHGGSTLIEQFTIALAHSKEVSSELEEAVDEEIQNRMRALQKADRIYWKPVIAEIKQLNASGLLQIENSPV